MTHNSILKVVGLVLMIFILYFYLSTEDTKTVDSHVEQVQDGKNHPVVDSEPEKVLQASSKPSEQDSNYDLSQKCGFSTTDFNEKLNSIDHQSLSDSELSRMDWLLSECENWFAELATLSVEELENIKLKVEEKQQILKELSIYKYQESTVKSATDMIFHEDADIAGTALLYLLSFDNEFLLKIGEKMEATDITFLRGNSDIAALFSCQNGLDCSVSSVLMQDLCAIDEAACGLTFDSWLNKKVTINQYNDYLHAIEIIKMLINSDWFGQRGVLSAVDS